MNRAIRRVSVAAAIMVILLLLQLTNVQVFQANSLRQDPRNSRMLLDEYSRQRGQITADGQVLAVSVPAEGQIPWQRQYPDPDSVPFSPVVGYYSLQYSTAGLESTQDAFLNGSDDRLWTERLRGFLSGRTPQGGNVDLTLSPAGQRTAYDALQRGTGQGPLVGSVAAVKPSTGEILSLASSPSFNPNDLLSGSDEASQTMENLTQDPGQPLLNHATQTALPPGSIYKVITTAAALESGMTPDSPVSGAPSTVLPGTVTSLENYGGSTCGGGGTTTLSTAFALSCNVPFVESAPQIGQDKFEDVAKRFGYDGQAPDIGVPTSPSGVGDVGDDAQLAMSAIGQSDVRSTTLQAAMMAATVSNNGKRMHPQLIRRLQAPNLSTVSEFKPKEAGEAVSPDIAAQLTTLMEGSEQHSGGGLPGVQIASKTGTAEHGEGDSSVPYTWYIAFAPGRDVAVAVCIESGPGITSDTVGATVAAPIGREVIGSILGGAQ
ncbi:penicillin-binding transpeptidase domain-containing protein [Dietzia sp.]|uniref:penicillin-binding transpeptidase domain-containing protein n=1 Tax=Dietzia sp. TaxID=1871616 RepID=UPI002FDB529B